MYGYYSSHILQLRWKFPFGFIYQSLQGANKNSSPRMLCTRGFTVRTYEGQLNQALVSPTTFSMAASIRGAFASGGMPTIPAPQSTARIWPVMAVDRPLIR